MEHGARKVRLLALVALTSCLLTASSCSKSSAPDEKSAAPPPQAKPAIQSAGGPQQVKISGRLVDKNGAPVVNASILLGETKREKGRLVVPAGEFKQGLFVVPPHVFTDADGSFVFEVDRGFFDSTKEYTLVLNPGKILQSKGTPITFRIGEGAGDIDLGKMMAR